MKTTFWLQTFHRSNICWLSSCCEYKVCGLFCEHQICVAEFIYKHASKTFPGFTCSNLVLWQTSAYMHLAYRAQTPLILQKLFDDLLNNELRGPTLGIPIPSNIPIHTPSPKLPAIDWLKECSKESATISKNHFNDGHISEYKHNCWGDLDFHFSEYLKILRYWKTLDVKPGIC